jgi:tetratricopeptide (TPR) repeat protein
MTARTVFVGVSIPRSGHHFLAALLGEVLRGEFSYCEYYSAEDCCRRIPCIRQRSGRLALQKNHDLDLTIDPHLPGVSYLVQYRDPVPAVVSDRELFAAVRGSRLAGDPSQYAAFLAEKAAHYTRFYDKWIRQRDPSRFLVRYEELLAEPVRVLTELCAFCEMPMSTDRLQHAVAVVGPILNRPPIVKDDGRRAFVPSVPSRSAYHHEQLLAIYESIVLDRVPEMAASRHFPAVDYRDHPLRALFDVHGATLDRQPEEAARLARAAHQAWLDDVYVSLVAGEALRRAGDHAGAVICLERAIAVAPHDAEVIVACTNANLATQNIGRAETLAAQLVALVPEDASHRLFHATILGMCGRQREALSQALEALRIGIAHPHLWQAFVRVVDEARRAGWALDVRPLS